jgi:hypothetical protein
MTDGELPEDKQKNMIQDDSWKSTLGRIIFVCVVYFIYPFMTLYLMDFLSNLVHSVALFAILLIFYEAAINLGCMYILYSGMGNSRVLNIISWVIILFFVMRLTSTFGPFISW